MVKPAKIWVHFTQFPSTSRLGKLNRRLHYIGIIHSRNQHFSSATLVSPNVKSTTSQSLSDPVVWLWATYIAKLPQQDAPSSDAIRDLPEIIFETRPVSEYDSPIAEDATVDLIIVDADISEYTTGSSPSIEAIEWAAFVNTVLEFPGLETMLFVFETLEKLLTMVETQRLSLDKLRQREVSLHLAYSEAAHSINEDIGPPARYVDIDSATLQPTGTAFVSSIERTCG